MRDAIRYHFTVEVSFDWEMLSNLLGRRTGDVGIEPVAETHIARALQRMMLSGTREPAMMMGSTRYSVVREYYSGDYLFVPGFAIRADDEYSLVPVNDRSDLEQTGWPLWQSGTLYFSEWKVIDPDIDAPERGAAPEVISQFDLWGAMDAVAAVRAHRMAALPPAFESLLAPSPWSTQVDVKLHGPQRIVFDVEPCVPYG